MSNIEAYKDSSICVVRGIVLKKYYSPYATYKFQVEEVIKQAHYLLPKSITIVDIQETESRSSEDFLGLEKKEKYVLFLQKTDNRFGSKRDIILRTQSGKEELQGTKQFFTLMTIRFRQSQIDSCILFLSKATSALERSAILDVMWETRTKKYIPSLFKVVNSTDPPQIRSWAITILGYLEDKQAALELIPLLDSQDNYIKRQTLVALGINRIDEAVPKIRSLIDAQIEDNLLSTAFESLTRIGSSSSEDVLVDNLLKGSSSRRISAIKSVWPAKWLVPFPLKIIQTLINILNDPDLAIRESAIKSLCYILQERIIKEKDGKYEISFGNSAPNLGYDPTADQEVRSKSIENWQQWLKRNEKLFDVH
jgi:HEAT repeat protein